MASIADDGSVSLTVSGATGIGRPGEIRVAHTIVDRLVQDVYDAKVKDGDDAQGIDRRLVVNCEAFVLQITVAPQASDFWSKAKQSSVSTRVSKAHAMSWIRDAVLRKSTVTTTENAPVVLASDVRHAGVVADTEMLSGGRRRYLSTVF